jgi:hypothetical protein
MSNEEVLLAAGLAQLGLALASLAIPRVLGWAEQTRRLAPLTRQVFWTYAGYIWVTNLCIGGLSVCAPALLLEGTPLARAVAGYVTAYWGARLLVQLFYFDRSGAPPGALYRIADVGLTLLFAALTVVYGRAAIQ